MINFILQYPSFYRLYQKTVRKNNHEYDIFKFIFSELSKDKKLKMLDLCSGDSFVLKYVGEYLDEYVGIDNNEKYLKKLKGDWPKFKFINADINELNNGAIHHLNDNVMSKINLFISKYEKSKFLSVDPIKFKNGIINKLMINLDRGKYIRTLEEYKNVMKGINHFVIDDFYKMSFQNIFHNRNFDLNKLYYEWKNSLKN